MKHFLFVFLFCLLAYESAFAQQSGAQILRLARSVYEQGRLHEIPDLINKNIEKFSKEEKVDAYRLLALSYIYLEEPEKADEAMLSLLNTDHFFEPNKDAEPAEFMGLYKTFRTKPVFNIGLKFGGNFTMPLLNNVYYVSSTAPGNGKYVAKFGIQAGIVFEKEFFGNSKSKILKRIVFAPEVLYHTRTFGYTNATVFASDSISGKSLATQEITFKQNWIDINPVFQFKFKSTSSLVTYAGFGPGLSVLLSASNTMVTTRNELDGTSQGVSSGPDVDVSSSYNKLVVSLIASAGLKYRFGSVYLVPEVRVQYAVMNPVNTSHRTVNQAVFDYAYTAPNYKPLNFTVNLGIVLPYFNPIKLKKK